jgi:hypothetical protein
MSEQNAGGQPVTGGDEAEYDRPQLRRPAPLDGGSCQCSCDASSGAGAGAGQ